MKLTAAQIDLLQRVSVRPNSLVNGDEGDPQWWIDGGFSVKSQVAKALLRRRLIRLTAREGGHPGVLFFSITPAGRAALDNGKED